MFARKRPGVSEVYEDSVVGFSIFLRILELEGLRIGKAMAEDGKSASACGPARRLIESNEIHGGGDEKTAKMREYMTYHKTKHPTKHLTEVKEMILVYL